MKKNGIMLVFAGVILLLIGSLLPYLFLILNPNTSSVGIIGGADSETLRLISVRVFHNIDLTLQMFGGAFVIIGLVSFFLGDRLHFHCTIASTILAFGISATFSFCVCCGLSFASCFLLTTPDKHPIRLPLSLILGVIGAGFFILLIDRYIKQRKINKSVWGMAADIGMILLYVIPFVMLFSSIESVLS